MESNVDVKVARQLPDIIPTYDPTVVPVLNHVLVKDGTHLDPHLGSNYGAIFGSIIVQFGAISVQ